MEHLRTKVTFIKNRFHVRLLENDLLVDETACENKIDIGWCCKYMLRQYDKMGGVSKMAMASRARHHKNSPAPRGKVWFEKDLRKVDYNNRVEVANESRTTG